MKSWPSFAARLVGAVILGAAMYISALWLLGWASELAGHTTKFGHALGVAAVLASPLAYGALLLVLMIIAGYLVLGQVIKSRQPKPAAD
jgi:hypothetical protein